MKIDLTSQAGFPLFLEPETLEVSIPGEIHFDCQARLQSQMAAVLRHPQALPDSTSLYWNFTLQDAGPQDALFKSLHLTFGLVLLPPMKIGQEYVKTHGHYHSAMPGSKIGFPEVYTHYFGDLYLLLQRRSPGTVSSVDDCVLYEMLPGESIMIPPGYAHILINPSQKPALMAGLYSQDALHEYEPIQRMAGGAYYLIEEAGQETAIRNPRYTSSPDLARIKILTGTRFSPPNDGLPLWSSFLEDTLLYSFMADPAVARQYFLPEDLRL